MTSTEVRSLFIHYFSERAHTEVVSASLIPEGDPSLLFVNAGMVQFKKTFLGEIPRPYQRAVSYQKCLRAGGKHNDLENVGQTARHHTFFEMLGNFSFGDYFKKDAIRYAWELLTDVYKIDPSRLWITVFREDDEAETLWQKIVPKSRIVRLDEKDNFWQMGETGPCGPCSEILIDQGEAVHANCPGIGHCDCDRYLEIWNLVFMQSTRDVSGKLTTLPKPSIDTGMGLERITAISQGVFSNYETDLFRPLFSAIAQQTQRSEGDIAASMPGKVIADHIRALTFLASDGIIPSNEGRGYLFRRILRRAARFGRQFGMERPFLHQLTRTVIHQMSEPFPELKHKEQSINQMVLGEEERFIHTLNHGIQLLDEAIKDLRKKGAETIPGKTLFTLYDTYGFPVDLTEEIAVEAGMKLDTAGFQEAMSVQKERARRSWVGAGQSAETAADAKRYQDLLDDFGQTGFTGYEHLTGAVKLLAILKDGRRIHSASAGNAVELLFSPSPFYGEGGGQVGDCGTLTTETAFVQIEQTIKPLPDLTLHHAKVVRGKLEVDTPSQVYVDQRRRHDTARNHTGTHLLHAILRNVLGDHVKQAGSLVAPDRLRFDFHHFAPLTESELNRIEQMLNEKIMANDLVQTRVMEMKEAMGSGAMALFGEKYGDQVRVVSITDFSRELCGGTHCQRTGEIGLFKIIKEGSVASGIRRIEALTGSSAYAWTKDQWQTLRNIATLFRSTPDEVTQKLERLIKQLQVKDREIERLRTRPSSTAVTAKDALSGIIKIGPLSVLTREIPPSEIKEVRTHADHLRDCLKSGIVVIGAKNPAGNRVGLVVMVTRDWTERYPATRIIQALSGLIDGKGGGKPRMAQAGGTRVENLGFALNEAIKIIERMS